MATERGKYHYAFRGYDLAIYEEQEVKGSYRKIATVINSPDKFLIASNMVAALNARDKFFKKLKNNQS